MLAFAWVLADRFQRTAKALDELNRDLEVRVDHRTRELREARDRIAQVDALRTTFFANVSHELRTPLTLILGPLEDLVRSSRTEAPTRAALGTMLPNARRLLRLIEQLLDLARLEAGRLRLTVQPTDVNLLVGGACAGFRPHAERSGLTLELAGHPSPLIADCDSERVERVLFNLLSNAVKFTGPGGRIRVATYPGPDGGVLVSVRDSGGGIPPADLPRIFERFHQVWGAEGRPHEGSGIGLALSREIVELHGGTLRAESTVGFGSTFTMTLPARAAFPAVGDQSPIDVTSSHARVETSSESIPTLGSTAEISVPPGLAESPSQAPPDAPLVLVVDDHPDLRAYLRASLDPFYRTVEAPDGHTAFELARTCRPAAVITDLSMPRLDGYGLCAALRGDAGLASVPVLMLTARASTDARAESLAAGADDYLSKPFNADELRARLANLLRLHRQERQLRELNERLQREVEQQGDSLARGRRIERFVPHQLAKRLMEGDSDLPASERRLVTILFCDLEGFTALADSIAPERLTALLNGYIAGMVCAVEAHGGLVDKVAGDGVMGLWGAISVEPPAEQARRAVAAAAAMQHEVGRLAETWTHELFGRRLRARIGLHQDWVTVGALGSGAMLAFTAMGTGVNIAARLEAACPPGGVLASEIVRAHAGPGSAWEDPVELSLKGLRPVRACRLLTPPASG